MKKLNTARKLVYNNIVEIIKTEHPTDETYDIYVKALSDIRRTYHVR